MTRLGLLRDYEGAHTNEMPAFVAVGVNPEDFDRGRNMKYRLINCVYFGCLSYAHILVIYSALYIIREVRQMLAEVAETEGLSDLHASAVVRTIEDTRTDLSFRARIANATHPMSVARQVKSAEQSPSTARVPSMVGIKRMGCGPL